MHSGEGGGSGIEEGETAGGAYKRLSGMWRKRRRRVFEGDRKDFVLLRVSSAGVCGFAGLQWFHHSLMAILSSPRERCLTAIA